MRSPRWDLYTRCASLAAVIVGVLTLAGWALDIHVLKSIGPGLATMKPLTALGFILAGAALALLQSSGPRISCWLGRVCAALLVVLGLAIVGQYLGNVDWGVDALLFRGALELEGGTYPGRMALMTAAAFVLLGAALLLLDARVPATVSPAQVLAFATLVISGIAVVGYCYGVSALDSTAAYSTMAIHTAVMLLLLAFGILSARPERGVMAVATGSTLGGVIIRRALPVATIGLFLIGWFQLRGLEAGYYQLPFGLALMVVCRLSVLGSLIIWAGWIIHRFDLERRRSEERIRLAVDAAEIGTWDYDPSAATLVWSDRCKAIFGLSPDEPVEFNTFIERLHPEDRERTRAAVEKSFDPRGNGEQNLDYRTLWPDGTVRWVIAKGRAFFSGVGQERHVSRVIGTVLDVTDRKRAEGLFPLVLEAAPNAMIMVDRQGRIRLVNAQAELVFGYAREELLNQPIEILIPERFRSRHPAERNRFFAAPVARSMGGGRDLHGVRKGGAEIPIEIGLNPIETPDGLCVLASIIDITERKLAEERAERHLAELTRMNRVKMAGEMASGLAHELNQPLTAIAVQAGLASAALRPHESGQLAGVRNRLDDIAEQAKRAGTIIRVLRNFVKKGEIHRAPVYLQELIHDVVRLMESQLRQKRIRLALTLEDLPLASVDKIQIGQLLLNLLQNAIDALDETEPALRILEVSAAVDKGEHIVVSIRDRGKGIPPDAFESIFESFFTTKPDGIGMGLTICRNIAEAHGARLWAVSEASGGTTFVLRLPLGASRDGATLEFSPEVRTRSEEKSVAMAPSGARGTMPSQRSRNQSPLISAH